MQMAAAHRTATGSCSELMPNRENQSKTTGCTQATVVRDKTIAAAPATINGRRRPQDERFRSPMAPKSGWIMVPHSGALPHIKDDWDLEIPKKRRYEDPWEKIVDQTI